MNNKDIRNEFASLLKTKCFTKINRDKSMTSIVGNKTIEIIGASFVADENVIFGELNQKYLKREHDWYYSQSLFVKDLGYETVPKVWAAIADKNGKINSNYGWCAFSDENHNQYLNAIKELKNNSASRRSIIIYTRPSIWNDYNLNGCDDFICTNTVQFLMRNDVLNCIVQMRSNDSIIGYKNDLAWQKHLLEKACAELNTSIGKIYWQVGSLHIYERDFYLVDHYIKTNDISISKHDYIKINPSSEFI